MVRLKKGPADGREVPDPPDRWVQVAVRDGDLHVFDVERADIEDSLNKVGRGGWSEYVQDPEDQDTYVHCEWRS